METQTTPTITNEDDLSLSALLARLNAETSETYDFDDEDDLREYLEDNVDYDHTLVRTSAWSSAVLPVPHAEVIAALPVPTDDDLDPVFSRGGYASLRIKSVTDSGWITWHREPLDPMNPRMLYKVVRSNGQPNYGGGGMTYDLPVRDDATGKWTPGLWTMVHTDPFLCEHGIHVTSNPENWMQHEGDRAFAVEVRGVAESTHEGDKCVAMAARLLYEVTDMVAERTARTREEEQLRDSVQDRLLESVRATQAAAQGKVHFGRSLTEKEVLQAIMQAFACPHCGMEKGRWHIERTLTEMERTTLRPAGLGSPTVHHAPKHHFGVSEVIRYSCCNVTVDASDFRSTIHIDHPHGTSFRSLASRFFTNYDLERLKADNEARQKRDDDAVREQNDRVSRAVAQAREQARAEVLATIKQMASDPNGEVIDTENGTSGDDEEMREVPW